MRVKGTDECKNTFRRGRRYTVTVGKTLQHMRAAVHRVQGPAQWGGRQPAEGGRENGSAGTGCGTAVGPTLWLPVTVM